MPSKPNFLTNVNFNMQDVAHLTAHVSELALHTDDNIPYKIGRLTLSTATLFSKTVKFAKNANLLEGVELAVDMAKVIMTMVSLLDGEKKNQQVYKYIHHVLTYVAIILVIAKLSLHQLQHGSDIAVANHQTLECSALSM